MLKKILGWLGYHRVNYTIKGVGFGTISGVKSWRLRQGAIVADTPNGKKIIFTAHSPVIEITGGGIRKTIAVKTEETVS